MTLTTVRRRTREVALAGALALALATLSTPHAQAASASDTYEHQIGVGTKAARADHGLKGIAFSNCLDGYAERRAAANARDEVLVHSNLSRILAGCHLDRVGENIAMGYPTGTAAVDAWMTSPGHRANILNPDFRIYGHGAVQDDDGRWWAVNIFGRAA